MRRFPISWDKTLSALGFRRNVKRIKRDYYRRKNSHIESLEVRAMLAADPLDLIQLEAEQFDVQVAGPTDQWVVETDKFAFSGTGYVNSTNDDGGYYDPINPSTTNSPRLDYQFDASEAGDYYVWVRAWKTGGGNDSLHIGLDGQALSTSDKIQLGGNAGKWEWSNGTLDGHAATVNVASAGTHTLNLWMREDGARVDRIFLTKDSNYTPAGFGSDIVVDTLADQSDNNLLDGISLREAIEIAGDSPGYDTITFDESLFAGGAQTITLGDEDGNGLVEGAETSSQLYIDYSVSIEGPGSELLTISGNEATRVINTHTNQRRDISLSGLTIADGRTGGYGAGIHNSGNHLTLDDVTFRNNASMHDSDGDGIYDAKFDGGALFFSGQNGNSTQALTQLTITGSTFEENYASKGGALRLLNMSFANAVIDTTTFANNYAFNQLTFDADGTPDLIFSTSAAKAYGGAIALHSSSLHGSGNKGSLTIRNSTFAGNEAMREGGAFQGGGGNTEVRIENSTFSGNKSYRGGAFRIPSQSIEIVNSTITDNKATYSSSSGGIDNYGADLTLHNTIVAGNLSSTDTSYDIRGEVNVASSHNLIGKRTNVTTTLDSTNTVDENLDPGLLPLGDYGGPTLTHALADDSPAIDAGSNAHAANLESDQRGGKDGFSARRVASTVDIGAIEYGAIPIAAGLPLLLNDQNPIDVATIGGSGGYQKSWVASNSYGDTITVWQGTGAEGVGIYYSILNGTNKQLSQPRLVDLGQDSINAFPKVVIDGEGRFAISWLWYDQDANSFSYWLRRYEANGSPIDQLPVKIFDDADNHYEIVSITANESGRILAVWRDRIVEYDEEGNPKVDENGYVIRSPRYYFRRFTTSGLSLDAAPREFFPTTDNEITLATSGRTAVVKSDGGFFLSWKEANEIKLAEFGSDGFQSGPAITVESAGESNSSVTPIDIALGPNDTPYVAWLRDDWVDATPYQEGDGARVSTRKLLVGQIPDGKLGSTAEVTSVISRDEWGNDGSNAWFTYDEFLNVNRPTLSVDGLGRFGIAWENIHGFYFGGTDQYAPEVQWPEYRGVEFSDDDTTGNEWEYDFDVRSIRLAWFGNTGAPLTDYPIEYHSASTTYRVPTLTSDASGDFTLTYQFGNSELWAEQYTLPQIVTRSESGVLTIDDRATQYDEIQLGTTLIRGERKVTLNGVPTQYDSKDITKIIIYAGHTDSRVDLTHLSKTQFPSLVTEIIAPDESVAPVMSIEVYGGAGDDVLFAPSDLGVVLYGEAGDDRLFGGDQDDLLIGGEGDDLLLGGAGDDNLKGDAGKDTLKGGLGDDDLFGGDGNDNLYGELGSDDLEGQAGNDLLDGGAIRPEDNLDEDGNLANIDRDTMDGGTGDDQYLITNLNASTTARDIEIKDASGIDTIDFSDWIGTTGITINLGSDTNQPLLQGNERTFTIDAGATIENVIGTPKDDAITGNSADNRIEGRAGTDTLMGAGGNDILLGEEGIDHLYGGLDVDNAGGGSDSLEGGVGDDNYYIVEETTISTVSIFDTSGNDTLDVQDASLTDTDTNARIIALDDRIDQTLGNVTILAGSLGAIETLQGRQLPTLPTQPTFTDDNSDPNVESYILPELEIASGWNSSLTEKIAWAQNLSLTAASAAALLTGDNYFFSLGPDAPQGLSIDDSGTTPQLVWNPQPGQEGNHTFTVYTTRHRLVEPTLGNFETTVVRTAKEITLTVLNSDDAPEIASVNLIDNGTSTDGTIHGVISHHDSLDGVEVQLVYTTDINDITKTFTVNVSVEVDEENSYRGTFRYEPEPFELEKLVETGTTATFDLTASPRTWDPLASSGNGAYAIHPGVSATSIALNTASFVTAEIGSLGFEHAYTYQNGSSETVRVTAIPTFTGNINRGGVVNDVDDLFVRFFYKSGANEVEFGKTRTEEDGSFSFTPFAYDDLGFTLDSEVEIVVKVEERTPLQRLGEEAAVDTESFWVKIIENTAPDQLGLIQSDNTSNPYIEGTISWSQYGAAFDHEDVTIEFSRGATFGTVEGVAVTNADGSFTFLPAGIDDNTSTTFSVRAVLWDNFENKLLVSAPQTIDITRYTSQNSAPEIETGSLALKYDQGSTGQASDPTITGSATKNGNPQAGIYVEYSVGDNTFTKVDGFAITDESGEFQFTPVGLELDTLTTIYVRAAEWDSNLSDLVGTPEDDRWLQGAPQSIPVTLVALTAPTVTNLQLVRETGGTGVSSDATISGEISGYSGDPSAVTIEFEVNGNIAGEVIPEEDGTFEFLADGYIDAWNGSTVDPGVVNEVRVRAIIPYFDSAPEFNDSWLGDDNGTPTAGTYADDYFNGTTQGEWSDDLNDQWFSEILPDEGVGLEGDWYNSSFTRDWSGQQENITGDWATYSFTLDSSSVTSGTTIPTATGINPTLTGTLKDGSDNELAGRTLEFTYDGKSQGTTVTDEDGNYSFTPDSFTQSNNVVIELVDLKYGSDTTNRSVVYDGTVSVSTDATLLVSSLELANPLTQAGENVPATSIDPTVKGTISKPGDVSLQIVEFDYDGDDIAEGSTLTDAQGNFEYEPTGIGTSTNLSIRSRVVNIVVDEANNTSYRTIGDWSEALEWTYVAQDAPEFEYFQLEQDTGHYGDYEVLDGITSNPNLVGRVVANGLPVAYQSVEFDHDGDGVIDGYASTDAEGRFRYEPQGLSNGFWNIQAQVVTEDINKGENLTSDWMSVTRTGRTGDVSLGVGFTLVDADPVVVASLTLASDNTLQGNVHRGVSGNPSAKGVSVEFFDITDTDHVFLGTAQTDSDGNFVFVPTSVDFTSGAREIEARPAQNVPSDVNLSYTTNLSQSSNAFSNPSAYQIDFRTVELQKSVSVSSTIPLYVAVRVGNYGAPIEYADLELVQDDSGTKYRLAHQLDITSVDSSSNPLEIRVVSYDTTSEKYLFSTWETISGLPTLPALTFVYADKPDAMTGPNLVPTIEATIDPVASNVKFNGETVTWEYEVEYDVDGDGEADVTLPVETPTSAYLHELEGIDFGTHDSFQSRVIGYGTFQEPITEGSTETTERTIRSEGDWVTNSITFENPAPGLINFSSTELTEQHNDKDPTFQGRIASMVADSVVGMTVEIDEDGDGLADGRTTVLPDSTGLTLPTDYLSAGVFEYTLQNQKVGVNTVQVRAVDSFSHTSDLVGDWFPVIVKNNAEDAPAFTSLILESYDDLSVDSITVKKTADPVISGNVKADYDSQAISRWVEFDHNNDGIVDGTAQIDALGNFRYEAARLAYGNQTIKARTVIQLADQVVEGAWDTTFDHDNDSATANELAEVTFLHEPESMPMITGTLGVLDQATGTIAGRVTLDGYAYEGKVQIDVVVAGTPVLNGYAYADSNGRFEYELLKLVQGNHQVRVTSQISDPNSTDGDYAGESRDLTVDYSPVALSGVPAITSLGLAYETGASTGHTSDPTLVGAVNLTSYGGVAPPQLYVEISYADGSDTITEDIAVNSDGKFEWTPDDLKAGITYSFAAQTKLWNSDPSVGAYEQGPNTANKNVTPTLDGDAIASIDSLGMLGIPQDQSDQVHKSGQAIFTGKIDNDGRSGGHIVHFDHNQDGIVDGTAITQSDGTFIYRADGIEAHDSLIQTMTAWVTEVDYWGESRTSVPETRDFILTRAPIVREFSYNSTTNKIEGSIYSETDHADLWIEYELFGSSLPGETPPTDVTDYLQNYSGSNRQYVSVDSFGNFAIDLPVALNGFASITLRGVDAREVPDPYVIDSLNNSDDSKVIQGAWELLTFEAGTTSTLSDVTGFTLQEDTGVANNETSNPSVTGNVNPFELVEIVTKRESDTTPGHYEEVAAERVVANSKGEFVFASQQFAEVNATGKNYEVIARTVSSDLTTLGNNSLAVQFKYIANGTSIFAGFDSENEGLLTGTVTSEGNVAGLRVEIDVDLGSGFDDAPDGYAITDASGNFSYQLYGYTAGQLVKARTRVIEWDPVDKKFTEPEFQTDDTHSANDQFTPTADSVNDPNLADNVTEGLDAFEHAEEAVEDAIRTVLSQTDLAWLYDANGNLNLGVWTTDIMQRGGVDQAGPEGDGSAIQPINITAWEDTSNLTDQTFIDDEFTGYSGNLGVFDATVFADQDFEQTGSDATLTTTIEVNLANYTGTDDTSLSIVDPDNADDKPSYKFEFVAEGTVDGNGNFVIDDYNTTETISYSFHTVDESYDENGFLYRTATEAGTYTLTYLEDNSVGSTGPVARPFDTTETIELQTWVEESGPESESGDTLSFNSFSYYKEETTNVGTIEATGTTGTETVNSEGTYTSTSITSSIIDDQDSTGNGTTGSTSSVDTLTYDGKLFFSDTYTVGVSSDISFLLDETINSSYNANGNGEYTESDGNGSWNYTANGSSLVTSTLSGNGHDGDEYTSFNATSTVTTDFNSSGSSGTQGEYSESGEGYSDSGDVNSGFTYNLKGNTLSTATVNERDDEYTVTGTQTVEISSVGSNHAGVDGGKLNITNERETVDNNYGSRIRGKSDSSVSSTTNYEYGSNGKSKSDGDFSVFANIEAFYASQSYGEVTDKTNVAGELTLPFRNNATVETTIKVDNSGNFDSKTDLDGNTDYEVNGNAYQFNESKTQSTNYSGVNGPVGDGQSNSANINNFTLTKATVTDRAFEDYGYDIDNTGQSRKGTFGDFNESIIESTESVTVVGEYTDKVDSTTTNRTDYSGPFEENRDGERNSTVAVDEFFGSKGTSQRTITADGIDSSGTGTDIWNVFSSVKNKWDNSDTNNGYVEILNGESIDSTMMVDNTRESHVNTVENSSVTSLGTRTVDGTEVSYLDTNSQMDTAFMKYLTNIGGTVQQGSDSVMSVISSESGIISSNSNFSTMSGIPTNGSGGTANSYNVSGTTSLVSLPTTLTTGSIYTPGTPENNSGEEINLPIPSQNLTTISSNTTNSSEFTSWNISESETDNNGDYDSFTSDGTRLVNSIITNTVSAREHSNSGDFLTNATNTTIEKSNNSSNSKLNGRTIYSEGSTDINETITYNAIGNYVIMDGEMLVEAQEPSITPNGRRKYKNETGWSESEIPSNPDTDLSRIERQVVTDSKDYGYQAPSKIENISFKYKRIRDYDDQGNPRFQLMEDFEKKSTESSGSSAQYPTSTTTRIDHRNYYNIDAASKYDDSNIKYADELKTEKKYHHNAETNISEGNKAGDKQTLIITNNIENSSETYTDYIATGSFAPIENKLGMSISAAAGPGIGASDIYDTTELFRQTFEDGTIVTFDVEPNYTPYGVMGTTKDFLVAGESDGSTASYRANEHKQITSDSKFMEQISTHVLTDNGDAINGTYSAYQYKEKNERLIASLDAGTTTLKATQSGVAYHEIETHKDRIDSSNYEREVLNESGGYNISDGKRSSKGDYTIRNTQGDIRQRDKNFSEYQFASGLPEPHIFDPNHGWDNTGIIYATEKTYFPTNLRLKYELSGKYESGKDGRITTNEKVEAASYSGRQSWNQIIDKKSQGDVGNAFDSNRDNLVLFYGKDSTGKTSLKASHLTQYFRYTENATITNNGDDPPVPVFGGSYYFYFSEEYIGRFTADLYPAQYQPGETPDTNYIDYEDFLALQAAYEEMVQIEKEKAAAISNALELEAARQGRANGDPRFAPQDPNEGFNEEIDKAQEWIEYVGLIPIAGDILGDGTNVVIDIMQGQYGNAALSAGSAFGLDLFTKGFKLGSKLFKQSDEVAGYITRQAGRRADEAISLSRSATNKADTVADQLLGRAGKNATPPPKPRNHSSFNGPVKTDPPVRPTGGCFIHDTTVAVVKDNKSQAHLIHVWSDTPRITKQQNRLAYVGIALVLTSGLYGLSNTPSTKQNPKKKPTKILKLEELE